MASCINSTFAVRPLEIWCPSAGRFLSAYLEFLVSALTRLQEGVDLLQKRDLGSAPSCTRPSDANPSRQIAVMMRVVAVAGRSRNGRLSWRPESLGGTIIVPV